MTGTNTLEGVTLSSEPRDVVLLRLPLDLYARAAQWQADLMREFALIIIGEESGHAGAGSDVPIPARLLKVVGEMRDRYAALTASTTQEIEEAQRRGEASADVNYSIPPDAIPPDAADELRQLAELLDEVDEFCRSGNLLTLAAPSDVAAFRRWFLGEFARQLQGEEPTPWPTRAGPQP